MKGPTDWNYWRHIETVELWQAVLLSLNIEPPGNGWLLDNAAGLTGDIPYEYLDVHGLADEFTRRSRMLRNRLETLHARTGSPSNVELSEFIVLPLFAAWAVEFEWENLPPDIVTLAHKWDAKLSQLSMAREDEERRADPAYKAEYDRISSLYDEQDKLQCEECQNFPYIDEKIKKRLSEIRYELAGVGKVAEAPVSPAVALPTMQPKEGEKEISTRWALTRPQRADALTGAIYAVLKDAHDANGPLPFPRDVMALCIKKCPHDVMEVTHDEIKFYDSKGGAETANVDAVRKRIERMTCP